MLTILSWGYGRLDAQLYTQKTPIMNKTCSSNLDSSILKRTCLVEQIEYLDIDDIDSSLPSMVPQEMRQSSNPSLLSFQAITLFPFIEYKIAQHCVFNKTSSPYCDQGQREQHNQAMNTQLIRMINSSSDELQHRALILACQRNPLHPLYQNENLSLKSRALMLFISTCGKPQAKRLYHIQQGLKRDPELLDMTLILLHAENTPPDLQWIEDYPPTQFAQSLLRGWAQGTQE